MVSSRMWWWGEETRNRGEKEDKDKGRKRNKPTGEKKGWHDKGQGVGKSKGIGGEGQSVKPVAAQDDLEKEWPPNDPRITKQ